MGLDESTPRQVAPSVGKNSAGLEVSAASSENGHSPIAPANGNSPASSTNHNSPTQAAHGNSPIAPANGNSPASSAKSTSAPPMNFNPHSPDLQEAFSGLESGLDLTVGALSFFVNNVGTQDLTDPQQLARGAPEAPSTALAPSSIPEACSPATTMSTGEIDKFMMKELQGEEAESAYRTGNVNFDLPLDESFDCGISLDDFYEPAIHNDSNVDSEIFTNTNLDSETHNGFANTEMDTVDGRIDNELCLEDLLDGHTGSDMSLDEDV